MTVDLYIFNLYQAGYIYVLHSTQFLSNLYMYLAGKVENSVDPDQLASKKPADMGLHCFQTGYNYPGLVW